MTDENRKKPDSGLANYLSQEDAEKTLERVTDGFFALNHDWEFTYVNDETANSFDRPVEDLIGKNIWDEFPETKNLKSQPKYQDAIETQSAVHFEEYNSTFDTWLEVSAYPSEQDLLVLFKDVTEKKKRRERLLTIHKTTRRLMRSEQPADIADIAVESAKDVLCFPAVALYYWNKERGVLEPAAATDFLVEEYEGSLPTLSGNESTLWDTFVEGETRTFDATKSEAPAADVYNRNQSIKYRVLVPIEDHGIFFAAAKTTGKSNELAVELLEILSDNVTAALDRAKREQSLAEKEKKLQRQNDQLSELKRINEIIRKIDRALVQTTNQTEIESAVCENLADIETYEVAWFGKYRPQTDSITVRASSGSDTAFLNQLLTDDGDNQRTIPARKALRSGKAIFTEDILDEQAAGEWRKKALKRGYQSTASLPIQFHETTYGIIELYANQPNAFSDEERTVLQDLGETIGNALNAIERKEALLTDTYTELKFRLVESEMVISKLATSIDCTIVVESLLPRSDDTWLAYIKTTKSDPETMVETAQQHVSVDTIEHIRSDSDDELFGLVLTELAGPELFAERGGTITAIRANSTETKITVKVPQSTEVRAFIESCRRHFPEIELISRQQSSEENSQISSAKLTDDLTGQQRKALAVALDSGFFAWPRDMTGEEVAESLGVTPPTFHRHLRIGLQKVVSRALD